MPPPTETPLPEMMAHYAGGAESDRLTHGSGPLEFSRTQELLLRFLPHPPAVVYDIGGGSGIYACWLARLGYTAHLLDPVPIHVAQAAAASQGQPDTPLASIVRGDARSLPFDSLRA